MDENGWWKLDVAVFPVEELLPWLYLKGVSTGDFSEALAALLGPNAKAPCCGAGKAFLRG